jgi:hypothetical protein
MRTISVRRNGPIGWAALTCAAFLILVAEGRAQDVDWSSYMDYATLTKSCQDWVKAHSEIATLDSLGKSYEGRDLWLVTITNRSTGSAEDKPALYVQGGIDSDEVITVQSAMYLLHRVLSGYGTDPVVTDLVDKYALYVAPNVIPDQSETFHQTPKRPRDSTTRPYDNDRDGLVDEDDMEDVDGDGRILQMRIQDPSGTYKADPDDPRLMVRRQPADTGTFYRSYRSEGVDNDGDGRFNEDPVGGVDPNRNWPAHWVQEYQQSWAGPYPLSEVENQHIIRFYMSHPNIAGVIDYHSSGNLLYRPSSVYPDEEMDSTDLTFYRALSERYKELTDGPVLTPLQGARARGRRGVYGSGIMIDWVYDHYGVFSFAPELWAFPVDEKGLENRDATEGERIDWARREFGDDVWTDWKPFDHPQLGKVELGGWSKPMPNNPIGPHVERIASEIVEWTLSVWSQQPRIELSEVDIEPIGEHAYRVAAKVANQGFLPTNVTERAITVEMAQPVFLTVDAAEGLQIAGWSGGIQGHRDGKKGIVLGHLGGWGSANAARPRSVDVELVVVDGRSNRRSPAKIQLIVDGKRAGKVYQTIELKKRGATF